MTKEQLLEILYKGIVLPKCFGYIEYDDVIQSIAVTLLQLDQSILDAIETHDSAQSYIHILAVNCIRREDIYYRKACKVIPADLIDVFPTTESMIYPFEEQSEVYADLRELRERVITFALKRIPQRHREILVHFGSGVTISQYAKDQMMEYNAARQLHHRAKKSLRLEFEKLQVPTSLWRLGESDKMSPDLLQWLVEGPYSAEILYTEIASDSSPSIPDSVQCENLFPSLVDPGDSTDHCEGESDILSMALQSEEQYEDDLS